MKAISLWQPWATAVVLGAKGIETRGWSTDYRGPLLIHAAARCNKKDLTRQRSHWLWCAVLQPVGVTRGSTAPLWDLLPFGAIIGHVDLVDCRPTDSFTVGELDAARRWSGQTSPSCQWTERELGDFRMGRFGWVLRNPRPIRPAIVMPGRQRLFDVPDELLPPAVLARLAGGANG